LPRKFLLIFGKTAVKLSLHARAALMSWEGLRVRPFRFRLSVFQNGINAREPELMTRAELQDALRHASIFDEARVNFIISTVDEHGTCEMINGNDHPKYLIERVTD
jgi:hypothetical protein